MNMKALKLVIVLLAAYCIAAAQQNPATDTIPSSQVETKPANCEFNISVLTGAHQKAGDNLVIMIARLGAGETLRNLNTRRLHNARTFLTEFGQRAPQTIVTAEGDGVDGYGRVEVYVDGKLFHVLMIRPNDDWQSALVHLRVRIHAPLSGKRNCIPASIERRIISKTNGRKIRRVGFLAASCRVNLQLFTWPTDIHWRDFSRSTAQ